jgi:hypothetical protein
MILVLIPLSRVAFFENNFFKIGKQEKQVGLGVFITVCDGRPRSSGVLGSASFTISGFFS